MSRDSEDGSKTTGPDFLGTGWAFPLTVRSGSVNLAAGSEDIRQAIQIILGTHIGERRMRPRFGSRLQELVFAANNESNRSLAAFYAREALDRWEPRIDVEDVQVTTSPEDEAMLLIEIDYLVRDANRPENLVYPFYLQR